MSLRSYRGGLFTLSWTRSFWPRPLWLWIFLPWVVAACTSRPETLGLTPDEVGLGAVGQTLRLQTEPRTRHGAPVEGLSLRFTSRDPAVATVDSSGLVTAVAHGATTVVVQAEGSDVMEFARVVVRLPHRLEVRPATTTCYIGAQKRLSARVLDPDGEAIPGVAMSWAVSDSALLNIEDNGQIVGLDEGTVTVTAEGAGLSGTSSVTVSWSPEQRAQRDAQKSRRGARRGGGSGGSGQEAKKGWDPRLSMFD